MTECACGRTMRSSGELERGHCNDCDNARATVITLRCQTTDCLSRLSLDWTVTELPAPATWVCPSCQAREFLGHMTALERQHRAWQAEQAERDELSKHGRRLTDDDERE